ncbi:hypothetical protein P2318_00450 [Myxococcaceae bacterium GXIMD 01537]
MKDRQQAQTWAWRGVLLGALVLAACGVAPEPLEGEPQDTPVEVESSGEVNALSEPGDERRHGPQPNWDEPTFAMAPALATDGDQFFVAWWDGGRTGQLYAARVSKQGRLLDPDSIALDLPPTAFPSPPAVAFDGKQFLVVWHGEFSLYLARVNRDGTLDGPYITLFTPSDHFPAGTPGLACSDRKCLVAWFTFGGSAGSGAVRGLTFRTDRSDLDREEVFISNSLTAINSFGLAVAWAHERYLVAWTDLRNGTEDILAARVRRDGTVLDPGGFTVSGAAGNQRFPDVTGTKEGFFVAWSDSRQGDADIFGARVKDGTNKVLDPRGIRISTSRTEDILPRIASDGREVLVTWSALGTDRFRVRAARVECDGHVRDRPSFAISDGKFPREVDSDAIYADGLYFAVYARAPVLDEPPWEVIVGTRVKHGEAVDSPRIRISHSPSVEKP